MKFIKLMKLKEGGRWFWKEVFSLTRATPRHREARHMGTSLRARGAPACCLLFQSDEENRHEEETSPHNTSPTATPPSSITLFHLSLQFLLFIWAPASAWPQSAACGPPPWPPRTRNQC